jgi:hypothetical protein
MSAYEERHKNLQEHVKDAHDEVAAALSEEDRSTYAEGIDRLERVIAFAAVALERTDPELISDASDANIRAAALQIANNPAAAPANAGPWGDALLTAVLQLPPSLGRELEQSVKDAAANFQRSASQRLNSLRQSQRRAKTAADALGSQIAEQSEQMSKQVEVAASTLQTTLAELEQAIATQKQGLDQLMTRQSSAFSEAQEERAEEFQQRLTGFKQELDAVAETARQEVEASVEEIRRMEKESAQLVGAIGLAGTAERYSEEVKDQAKVANRLRLLTIALALGAVAMGVYAVVAGDQTNQALAAKLAVSVILGGLAAYTARQSGRHRRREEQARRLQLELTAFGPFIEPLQPEQREEERVIMARKTFGKSTEKAASEEEPGPTALSFLLQRRQKELDAEE